MIRPQRAFIIPRNAARVQRKAEYRFVCIIEAKSSSDICRISLSRVVPALLTRMLTGPSCSLAVAKRRVTSSRSEEHTSELQSHRDLHSFPTRRSSDLHLQDQLVTCRASVIDQDANWAKLLTGRGKEARDLLFLADIGLHSNAASAPRLDAGLRFTSCASVAAIINDDICPGQRQALCSGSANSLAASRHQRDFSC